MSLRIISGVTGAIFAVAILLLNKEFLFLINFLVALIAAVSMIEIFNAIGMAKLNYVTASTVIFVTVLPITGYGIIWQIFLYFYTILMLGLTIFNSKYSSKFKIENIALVYMLAVIITVSLNKIIEIRSLDEKFGGFYALLALGTAWTSDTGAYFCGKFLGKNKLCPEISPKKTIEGVIGGVAVCVISLILIGLLFNNLMFYNRYRINYILLIFMGIIGSLVSALGDLCFSAIKRSCHIKDFGNVIPGHGGILDRFDSVIFVVPYVYLFLKLFPVISG